MDPSGRSVDCGLGDTYCNESRREYYYSWRMYSQNSSFNVFLRAKDAYYFYYHHPNIALLDQFKETDGDSWDKVDAYTLARIYSENVKHRFFEPVSDEIVLREIDRVRATNESVTPELMALIFGTGIKIWMSQDEGGGGISYTSEWYRSTFPSAEASAQYHFAKHGSQWSSIEEYTQAAKDFYAANIDLAQPWPINQGKEIGIKITTNEYFGIYTLDGKIVTFGPR